MTQHCLFLILFLFGTPLFLGAQEAKVTEQTKASSWGIHNEVLDAPPGTSEEMPVNPELKFLSENTVKGLDEIENLVEGYFIIDTKNKEIKIGSRVLFLRRTDDGIDILSRGVVDGQQEGKTLVKLEKKATLKIPRQGDKALFMSLPWNPKKDDDDSLLTGAIKTSPPPLPDEPGFIQLDWGPLEGKLKSDTPNDANFYKESSYYRFNYTHFAWYPEFLWRVGIEYETFKGNYPTFSYRKEEEKTSQDFTAMALNYRFRKILWDTSRVTLRLLSISDIFETSNPDEAIISSSYSGMGIGMKYALEFASDVWTTNSYQPFALNRIYTDLSYFNSINAKDNSMSRGEQSNGSRAVDLRVGFVGFAYLKWMPFIKRFSISGFMARKSYTLIFKGPTISEEGSVITIPEGATYHEYIDYGVISIGIRFDDFVGAFFMPR